MSNPQYLSREIAHLIESDPIAASQIKEHIKPAKLIELLEIEETVDIHNQELLNKRGSKDLISKAIDFYGHEEIVRSLIQQIGLPALLKIHRENGSV